MTLEQVRLFLDSFKSQFWKGFAELHFFIAGKVQEAGGIQWGSVDRKQNLIRIEDVSIWGHNNKKFAQLKETPKNREQGWFASTDRWLTFLNIVGQIDQMSLASFFDNQQEKDWILFSRLRDGLSPTETLSTITIKH